MASMRESTLDELRARGRTVEAMVARLRDLLEGQTTREDVEAWALSLGSLYDKNPFKHHDTAYSVHSSIVGLTRERDGEPRIRRCDLEAYVRWLEEGELRGWSERALAVFAAEPARLAELFSGPRVRWWVDGLGIASQLRFASRATGRPFTCERLLDSPEPAAVSIHVIEGDDRTEAAKDLFELLGVDDSDTTYLDEAVDRSRLITCELWRQDDDGLTVRIRTFRSYEKARRAQEELEDRGHEQMYRVVVAGTPTPVICAP
jgi:hypothetical protein